MGGNARPTAGQLRLLVVAVGALKRGPERELADRYRDRAAKAGRTLGFRGLDVIEIAESRAGDAGARNAEEGKRLSAAIPEGAVVVALDEHGESKNSGELAAALARWRDAGRPAVIFLIGGPDGLAPSLRQNADICLAFGALTWPHQLARIMLMEQIYRVVTILAGHPYHRA